MTPYLWLGLAWSVWAALHSALLSDPVRAWIERQWPLIGCHWRFFFTAAALATILPPAWFTHVLGGPWVLVWPVRWPIVAINLAALAVGWMAVRAFGGVGLFSGLGQLAGQCEPPQPAAPLRQGILGWVRHPLYAVTLVLLWAHDMRASGLTASLVLTAYVLIGTALEERRLVREWGPPWLEYRREVSAFVPVKKIRFLLGG